MPAFMGHGADISVGAEDDDVTPVFGLETTEHGLPVMGLVLKALIGDENESGCTEAPTGAQNIRDFLDVYGSHPLISAALGIYKTVLGSEPTAEPSEERNP